MTVKQFCIHYKYEPRARGQYVFTGANVLVHGLRRTFANLHTVVYSTRLESGDTLKCTVDPWGRRQAVQNVHLEPTRISRNWSTFQRLTMIIDILD